MDITIYQIDPERARLPLLFADFERTAELQGSREADASIYARTYEGSVNAADLEDVYEIFNLDVPDGHRGRAMSVSDVVAVRDPETGEKEFFFCDSIGFRKIAFDESRAAEGFREKIRVVLCEPGKMARSVWIGTELEDLQKAVGGAIEAYYPFDEQVCIVCNDEGKLNGMPPNRAVRGGDGGIRDVIFGPFFVCACGAAEFGSLSDEQTGRYASMFARPERFFRADGEIRAVPYVPENASRER